MISSGFVVGSGLLSSCGGAKEEKKVVIPSNASSPSDIKISLAEWSLNKEIFNGDMDHLDFAAKAAAMGFPAVEYVNQFFMDKAGDQDYLKEMNMRASDAGVQQLLIMIDSEGDLAQLDSNDLNQSIENHKKWVEAARTLGCHSIRVNARGSGPSADVAKAAVEGLSSLSEFAKDYDVNVIVENHGGYSSNGMWLASVMDEVGMDNCGTLPDFGNFCINKDASGTCTEEYDKYRGVKDLMPYAKAVSAKTFDFNYAGDEVDIDYVKMMRLVLDAGYKGYVGIEYEGARMDAEEGILATKQLIEKVLAGMA